MSAPEPAEAAVLTGVDFCPACEVVVTWQRHVDELTGHVVHDPCSATLVPAEAGNRFHARAMSVHEAAHSHQLLDAHGAPPLVAGSPGRFEIVMELPISCAHCETTSEDLVAGLDDSEHDIEILDGRVRVFPVVENLPAHLDPENTP